MICAIPPKGWKCSREFGHKGPCAAASTAPYDTYVETAMKKVNTFSAGQHTSRGVEFGPYRATLEAGELRGMLADAWLAGLAYSLELLEKK